MLRNMQQGILTVVEGGVVHAEYSAYLETIFETNDIAGRDLMALVFDDSNIGSGRALAGRCGRARVPRRRQHELRIQ